MPLRPPLLRSAFCEASPELLLSSPPAVAPIRGNWQMDGLGKFTVAAWVRPDLLSKKGHGFTIVNKGPGASARHFWIDCSPSFPPILEMGGEKFR